MDEALINGMFNLKENISVEFLHTAEQQMHYYPDLTKGLISVILYYDAHHAIVNSLKILVQARKSFLWAVDTSEQVANLVTKYSNKLVGKGLSDEILILLDQLNLEKEIKVLQRRKSSSGWP